MSTKRIKLQDAAVHPDGYDFFHLCQKYGIVCKDIEVARFMAAEVIKRPAYADALIEQAYVLAAIRRQLTLRDNAMDECESVGAAYRTGQEVALLRNAESILQGVVWQTADGDTAE